MSRLVPPTLATWLFVLLVLTPPTANANRQDRPKVDNPLTFLDHVETIYVNIDQKPLVPWLEPIFNVLETRFARETKPRTIVVQVTLHTDSPAEVVVASRPALSDADTKVVLAAVDSTKSP